MPDELARCCLQRVEPNLREPDEPLRAVELVATHQDVTRALLEGARIDRPEKTPERYTSLWDNAELRRLLPTSPTWKQLRPQLRGILQRSREPVRPTRLRRLQRTCVTIDARLRGILVGSTSLGHGVTASIALVIAKRLIPARSGITYCM